jgi:hypothetical protein
MEGVIAKDGSGQGAWSVWVRQAGVREERTEAVRTSVLLFHSGGGLACPGRGAGNLRPADDNTRFAYGDLGIGAPSVKHSGISPRASAANLSSGYIARCAGGRCATWARRLQCHSSRGGCLGARSLGPWRWRRPGAPGGRVGTATPSPNSDWIPASSRGGGLARSRLG